MLGNIVSLSKVKDQLAHFENLVVSKASYINVYLCACVDRATYFSPELVRNI